VVIADIKGRLRNIEVKTEEVEKI